MPFRGQDFILFFSNVRLPARWRERFRTGISKLAICATLETTLELLDPENHEILFGPMLGLAGHHWRHR